MYGLERLEEAAVKVWNGVNFSQAETAQIKKEFRVLRKRCLNALSAITFEEVRSQSLVYAVLEFEAGRLTLDEYLSEVDYNSRSITGSKGRIYRLREKIAYHLAFAVFAYAHIKPFRRVPNLVISAEFLRHMAALETLIEKHDAVEHKNQNQAILAA
jgi:hypothetical protein